MTVQVSFDFLSRYHLTNPVCSSLETAVAMFEYCSFAIHLLLEMLLLGFFRPAKEENPSAINIQVHEVNACTMPVKPSCSINSRY